MSDAGLRCDARKQRRLGGAHNGEPRLRILQEVFDFAGAMIGVDGHIYRADAQTGEVQ